MAEETTKILEIKVNTSDAIKKIVEYRKKIEELKEAEKGLSEQYKKNEIDEQTYRVEMEKTKIKTREYTNIIRVLSKEVNNNIKVDYQKKGSLKGLRAELSNLTKQYDELSREERENARGKDLLNKINKVTVELKEAEIATQRYYRNVGNYASAFNGLGMSIQQVARELPSLSMGFNTFFLAISNNLPILVDELTRARKEYAALIKEGKAATPVWKQVISSIFSWQTALVAGVTILSMYGKEIINWVASLFRGNEAINDMYMKTEEFQKAVGELSGQMISELERMSVEWINLGNNIDAQNKFIEDNKKNFEQLGVSINDAKEAENAFVSNKETFIESITQRAKAAAMMDVAAEKYAEATRKMMEAEAMPEKKTYKTYQGTLFHGKWVTRSYENKERKEAIKEAEKEEEEADKIVAKAFELDKKGKELLESVGIKVLDDSAKKMKEIISATDKELQAIRQMEDALTDIIKKNKEIERNKVAESYNKEIEALKGKLNAEKELTEQSQMEILSLIETTERKKQEMLAGLTIDSSEYEETVKLYDAEIEALKDKLQKEKSITEESQNEILDIIKAKEKEKQEAVAKVSIIDADLEEERQRTILAYDREIEDLKIRLEREKDLTGKAREAIIETIKAKEIQKENELDKLNDEALSREVERRQKLIQLQLESVKEGSEKEFQLKMEQLAVEREAELQNKELTEQMKLAIVAKYDKLMSDATTEHNNEVAQKQADAIKMHFDTAIAEAYGNEQEVLRLQMEQKKAELDTMAQLENESIEAYNLRRLNAENEYTDAKQKYADKQNEIEQSKLEAASAVTGGLLALTQEIGESNRAMAIASKVLALAQIAIDTGRAISAGVAEAVKIGFPQNIGAIATTVATVLANIAAATKAVKSAKFATGGDVTGAGTGTSDSIPAMLSNGESVMTARATSMFAPILSAFNQAGGGVPIHGQQTGNQAMGEDMLAKAFAKGVANMPNPVVAVEEINTVSRRVEVIENLNKI